MKERGAGRGGDREVKGGGGGKGVKQEGRGERMYKKHRGVGGTECGREREERGR